MAKGTISFTFDDGISKNMARLLDILDQQKIVGTFFIIGESLRIKKNMDIAVEAHRRGHILANHTMTHPNITKISADALRGEVRACEELLEKARGKVPVKLFRPPYCSIMYRNSRMVTHHSLLISIWFELYRKSRMLYTPKIKAALSCTAIQV